MYWNKVRQSQPVASVLFALCLYSNAIIAAEGPAVVLRNNDVDLFVDVLLVNEDKDGESGFFEDANSALMSAIIGDAKRQLRGKVNLYDSFAAIGLSHGDSPALYHIENEKLTKRQLLTGVVHSAFEEQVALDAVQLFRTIVNKSGSNGNAVAAFGLAVSQALQNEGSDYLLVIQASSHSVGALTWLTADAKSNLSGGGKFLQQVFGGVISVALIDKRTSKAIWAMQRTIRDYEKAQMQTLKIVRELANALPDAPGDAIKTAPADVSQFNSLAEAKEALKANVLSREQYDEVADRLRNKYEKALADLESKRKKGEISPPAFEILSLKAKIDYSGG